ncbi:MAG TPA: hypothetical protein ENO21_04770, partial [Firmicutes bacterium]|nr:hypothetical protein [Bacillota bacterium]
LKPFKWRRGQRELAVFFRDTRLADNIGFEYSRWNAETAARHFVKMCSELSGDSGQNRPVVTVALDGENPWESYHDGGSRFLACLFAEIAGSADLECRLPGELAAEGGLPELDHVSPGSWIGGNFDVWSRHPETRRAWTALAAAHASLAHNGNEAVDQQLQAALASDYFWWYGDDFASNEKGEFDELFRSHLQQAYEAAGAEIPAELTEPLGLPDVAAAVPSLPTIVPPVIDGRLTTYYEWHGALRELGGRSGAMARQGTNGIREMRLAVSGGQLFMLLDIDQAVLKELGRGGATLRLAFGGKRAERMIEFDLPPGDAPIASQGIGVDRVIELVIGAYEVGLAAGESGSLELQLELGDLKTHRFPAGGPFRFSLPAGSPELDSWMV